MTTTMCGLLPPITSSRFEAILELGKALRYGSLETSREFSRDDMAIAPTGRAARLVGGSTDCRYLKLPVGKKSAKAPSGTIISSVKDVIAFHTKLSSVLYLCMDEDSMTSRSALPQPNTGHMSFVSNHHARESKTKSQQQFISP